MTLMLLLLLQQPPALEEGNSTGLDEGRVLQMTVSRTGKYLVLGCIDRLVIYSADAHLQRIKTLDRPWTAFAFDERDEHLQVVGIDLVRIDTVDWKERSQEALEGQDIQAAKIVVSGSPTLKPRQAWIDVDGTVYYRAGRGGVARAVRKDGKLVPEPLAVGDTEAELPIQGIVGAMDRTPFLVLTDRGKAGVLDHRRAYFLAGSSFTFYAAVRGDRTVWVGETYEGLYDPRTWKVQQHRSQEDGEQTRNDAVLDPKSGWVLVAEDKGLRAWNTKDFHEQSRYKEFTEPCLKLALDGERRLLYTLEETTLRRWPLKD